MLGARENASGQVTNELSLASWHLIGWEDGKKFLDQSRSEERWDPHYFRPYSGIALQSIRRDSIHNLRPHCNVISLRYSDKTYFPEYNVKMSSGLVASGPTAFSAMQNTAWRFSVKPCVRIINWIIIIINFQTLYIAVNCGILAFDIAQEHREGSWPMARATERDNGGGRGVVDQGVHPCTSSLDPPMRRGC